MKLCDSSGKFWNPTKEAHHKLEDVIVYICMSLSHFRPVCMCILCSYVGMLVYKHWICSAGIGRGLMTGILLLNLYFDKHRSLATGLGMSGVGVGTLWVVPLTQYLFDEYDFSVSIIFIMDFGDWLVLRLTFGSKYRMEVQRENYNGMVFFFFFFQAI